MYLSGGNYEKCYKCKKCPELNIGYVRILQFEPRLTGSQIRLAKFILGMPFCRRCGIDCETRFAARLKPSGGR